MASYFNLCLQTAVLKAALENRDVTSDEYLQAFKDALERHHTERAQLSL